MVRRYVAKQRVRRSQRSRETAGLHLAILVVPVATIIAAREAVAFAVRFACDRQGMGVMTPWLGGNDVGVRPDVSVVGGDDRARARCPRRRDRLLIRLRPRNSDGFDVRTTRLVSGGGRVAGRSVAAAPARSKQVA